MKKHKTGKLAAAMIGLLALGVTQTGFVAGLASICTPAGLPIMLTGIGFMVLGGAMTPSHEVEGLGYIMLYTGFVLDEKDPGTIAALNEIPNTEAQRERMGVTDEEIQAYNEHLSKPAIAAAYDQLKSETANEIQAWSDDHPEAAGHQIGVRGVSQIPGSQLKVIAENLGLELSDAKILLYKGFGTKTID